MTVTERFATSRYYCLMPVYAQLGLTLTDYARWQRLTAPRISKCAYRLHTAERKIDTKVRNIRQQKCYNDLRKGRRSLVWHEQRASRLKNFALVSARKRAARRNYSGFAFQTASFARNAAVRNITQFANGTRSSAAPVGIKRPSRPGRSCTARTCRRRPDSGRSISVARTNAAFLPSS